MTISLKKIAAVWTDAMEEVVGPHIGTAFHGLGHPAIGDELPKYDWRRIESEDGDLLGFLWLTTDTECEISLVVAPNRQSAGVGSAALVEAERVAASEYGATVFIGTVDAANEDAARVAHLLTKQKYRPSGGMAFSQRLLTHMGVINFVKETAKPPG